MRDRECMGLVTVTYIMAVSLKDSTQPVMLACRRHTVAPIIQATLENDFTRRAAGVCSSPALSLVFLAVF